MYKYSFQRFVFLSDDDFAAAGSAVMVVMQRAVVSVGCGDGHLQRHNTAVCREYECNTCASGAFPLRSAHAVS